MISVGKAAIVLSVAIVAIGVGFAVAGLSFDQISTPVPSGVSMKLGNEGGTLVSEDKKLMIEFPKDAVSKPIQVSITNVMEDQITDDMKSFEPLGSVYQLEPDGLVFEKPATIILKLDAKELGMDLKEGFPLFFGALHSSDGTIAPLDNTKVTVNLEENEMIITAQTSHFSSLRISESGLTIALFPAAWQAKVGETWDVSIRTSGGDSSVKVTLTGKFYTTPPVDDLIPDKLIRFEAPGSDSTTMICKSVGTGYYGAEGFADLYRFPYISSFDFNIVSGAECLDSTGSTAIGTPPIIEGGDIRKTIKICKAF